ncbi:sensor histidine kinase [Leptolyngbya boryana CZ1]|uniref:histidine kinase n=1 Tax=Leptolyngbya boryana CZ1 TaxID=3060204 RepID=A0AA96WZ73_LEPBY|nr:sensor histidine kinase [Leptolyngbya boryana]WNZ46834.1 sensor histidine kinase [Leptolyngbya boryana CZ1]
MLTFEVTDQGIGIPEPDLLRLFDSFHRGQNVGTIRGTGLGLAIVQRCVELHQGTITVERRTPGTVFRVKLMRS